MKNSSLVALPQLLVASVLCAASTPVALTLYYRTVSIGAIRDGRWMLVWFGTTLVVTLAIGLGVYGTAIRRLGSSRRAMQWAVALMITATIVMLCAEWAVTWYPRPRATLATALHRLASSWS